MPEVRTELTEYQKICASLKITEHEWINGFYQKLGWETYCKKGYGFGFDILKKVADKQSRTLQEIGEMIKIDKIKLR